MRDVIIEGTLVQNHFNIFDTNFYRLLSDNAETLVYKGVVVIDEIKSGKWEETVTKYNDNIKKNIIETRSQNEIEYNILINGLPLNAELLDFTVYAYNTIKNSFLDGKGSVVLQLKNTIAHSKSLLENYIKQMIKFINAKKFEVKIISPKAIIAHEYSWAI